MKILTIGKDLSEINEAQKFYDTTTKQNIQVDFLIINACFGDFGMFAETDRN